MTKSHHPVYDVCEYRIVVVLAKSVLKFYFSFRFTPIFIWYIVLIVVLDLIYIARGPEDDHHNNLYCNMLCICV